MTTINTDEWKAEIERLYSETQYNDCDEGLTGPEWKELFRTHLGISFKSANLMLKEAVESGLFKVGRKVKKHFDGLNRSFVVYKYIKK